MLNNMFHQRHDSGITRGCQVCRQLAEPTTVAYLDAAWDIVQRLTKSAHPTDGPLRIITHEHEHNKRRFGRQDLDFLFSNFLFFNSLFSVLHHSLFSILCSLFFVRPLHRHTSPSATTTNNHEPSPPVPPVWQAQPETPEGGPASPAGDTPAPCWRAGVVTDLPSLVILAREAAGGEDGARLVLVGLALAGLTLVGGVGLNTKG